MDVKVYSDVGLIRWQGMVALHEGASGRGNAVGASGSPLLRSRLRPPANPDHYLCRPRLIELLDVAAAAPITLVVAPAGSGKTSLLSDWYSTSTTPMAWLSLDETDRDSGQFWSAVGSAVAELDEGVRSTSGSAVRPGTAAQAAEELLASLDENHPYSSVLVIDDIHLVDDNEPLVESVALFLNSLPRWLHVVLISRRTPKLAIDRLRARGQLGEIHFTELRFLDQEAHDLLERLAPSLSEDQVNAAVVRCAGWAAGLQLTALAARSERAQQPIAPVLNTSDLLLADYVWHEVLSQEDPAVVEVLLDNAVVKRTSPALAEALTGRPNAGELLHEAESRGLFVTRLGPSGWVEVHAVVREELLAEAIRRSPERVGEAHSRAAHWYENALEIPNALDQWMLADRPREALRLLARNVADLYDSGREATIERTLAQIPLSVATADLESMIEFAWCHLLVDRNGFLKAVRLATVWLDRFGGSAAPQVGRLGILQSIAATINGDWARGNELATQAMAVLGDRVASDALGRFGWNMVAREIALSETWDDDSLTLEGVRLELSRDPERRLAFEGTRALGESLAGRPVDALRIAAGVKDVADVNSMTILRAEINIARALAHRELGDRARALTELDALCQGDVGPVSHAQALAMLELTQLRLDEGNIDAADEMLSRARAFVQSDFSGVGGTSWLARTAMLVALASGRTDDARTWCEEIRDPFWAGVGSARIDLSVGRFDTAAVSLEQALPRCVRHHVVRDLLRARATDSPNRALEFVTTAVESASSTGLVQTVASEGADVLELLEHNAWLAPLDWLDRVRRAGSTHAGHRLVDPSLPGEHLTDREMEVLRMLPSRLTLREIAGELFISANTLKFHLRVIYRKLGVGSREDAAAVARRMTSPGRPRGVASTGKR